ncbi:hypothetical protein FA10DRAFT_281156 [Acaromyces ingoldii]|uniref:dolichyl-phosphate beta-glucosyltransferase n=1 Tax=Acaromyces ingoldii TaxID=215250 RepID=A0A316YHN9_9BASI|nr:hypothetical protein FA10DRAFT_281156 [Acaromyces ingoldii]PWN88719.1 hypothetical protein FA10DRAFT_281156 [Acaromyces ingoldii]
MAAASTPMNGTGAAAGGEHARHAYARTILGPALAERLRTARVLVVGAGGIGCELLKNLVLVGVGHVDIIDLDTIDLSNLNRQFLFQKAHIGRPKALVAAATARQFVAQASVAPHHANIKDTRAFGWTYFAHFDAVCNALDNLDARRWVNAMCVQTGVPLVESGTTGFNGQVQPICPGTTECFDCVGKVTPRTYPVCTIRSTPSAPVHCVVWAKTWLFGQLFGAQDESEDAELEKALAEGENADEIASLRKEASEMRRVREGVLALDEDDEAGEAGEEREVKAARSVFDKVFKHDVERLLSMDDMWRARRRPVPLAFDGAMRATDEERQPQEERGESNLRDQQRLSLRQTVQLFQRSLVALARRARASGEPQSFDKDDDDALDFVTATANLRSRVYGIGEQTRFQVKEMAGNIIPAIASTNAVTAGAQVLQLLHALGRDWARARLITLTRSNGTRLLTSARLGAPNAACGVCQDVYMRACVDVRKCTIGHVVRLARQAREHGGLGFDAEGIEVYEGTRLLADEDFDDNVDKPLADVGLAPGMTLTLVDDDGAKASLNLVLDELPAGDGVIDVGPADALPAIKDRAKLPGNKHGHGDDDDDDDSAVEEVQTPLPPKKRARQEPEKEARGAGEEADSAPAAKRARRLATTARRRRRSAGMASCCPGHDALAATPGMLAQAYAASPYLTALLLGPPLLGLVLLYPALVVLSPSTQRRRLPACASVYYDHRAKSEGRDEEEKLASLVGDEASVQLSVVVPAYNEARRLTRMLDEAVAWLDGVRVRGESLVGDVGDSKGSLSDENDDENDDGRGVRDALVGRLDSYEILVVDDGSTDDTARIASEYAAGQQQVRVVRMGINCGKGAAVRHGVLHARGRVILFADADGASRFADLRVLSRELARIQTGAGHGVVCGSRAHLVGSEAVVQRSFVRNFLMHAFHLVLALLLRPPSPSALLARLAPASVFGRRGGGNGARVALPAQPAIRDTQCGFKLFSRPTAQVVFPRAHIDRWIFDVELLLLAEMASRATLLDAAARGHEWRRRRPSSNGEARQAQTSNGGAESTNLKAAQGEAKHREGQEEATHRDGLRDDVLLRLPVPIAEVAVQWAEVEGSKIALLRDSVGMALDLVVIRANYALGRWARPPSLLSVGEKPACCQ